jgi:two-component sensor histidine kinase
MSLNARQVFYEGSADATILLGIEDITTRRALECEREKLLRQKEVLLEEVRHRVTNSLQIIASIILMKARTCNRQRPAFICKTRIRESCRLRQCRSTSMHRRPAGRSI